MAHSGASVCPGDWAGKPVSGCQHLQDRIKVVELQTGSGFTAREIEIARI